MMQLSSMVDDRYWNIPSPFHRPNMFFLAGQCGATGVRKTSITSSYRSVFLYSDLDLIVLWMQAKYGVNILALDNLTNPEPPFLQTTMPFDWNPISSAGADQAQIRKKIDEFFLYSRDW